MAVLGLAWHKQTSLLCRLQAQTLPDSTPPIANTRRYGQLRGPTSSSWGGLEPLEWFDCSETSADVKLLAREQCEGHMIHSVSRTVIYGFRRIVIVVGLNTGKHT